MDYKKASNAFFVRTKADKAAVEAAFGEVTFVEAPGVTGETAFVTEKMTEADYEKKSSALVDIVQMIRMN